jgi:hypothetical protein
LIGTLQALSLVLGPEKASDVDYLDSCRIKRNSVEYDLAGQTSPEEAKELIDFASELKDSVSNWLKEAHPNLA